MKAPLLCAVAVVLAVAVTSAHADDFAASVQDSIHAMTDLRNDYLIEKYFGESYLTQRAAAMETVNSAIELYELTRAYPYALVAERGTTPANQPGAEVAFAVINSMKTDMDVYPFVVDAGTLNIVAEGAFPATVGLSAFFFNEADRPWEDVLNELHESDGAWVTYNFVNHNTGSHDDKRVWLSLHDGYIFGAGYYQVRDDDAFSRVGSMVNAYDAGGVDSFAGISGNSFVLDAGTLEIVAHADPDVTESAIRDALGATWHLESLSDVLAKHGSLSVSYPSTDPHPGGEYVRAHLRLHDGYVFGSGYGVSEEQRIQSLANEAVDLYDLEGKDAFGILTKMEGVRQIVLELESNTIEAFAGWPNLVGLNLGTEFFDQGQEEIIKFLEVNPGLWTDSIFVNPLTPANQEMRSSSWVILRDGYIFSAANVYSPEVAAIDAVNDSIELYKTHGEGAFDRITWQSAVPEIIYPFVFDAETWMTVAHGAYPDRLGQLPAAITADYDLDAVNEMLAERQGVWLSYEFYNPITDLVEYKRAWLSTYDGYTFAAGYYYGNFESMEGTIQDVIDIYEAEGKDAAFARVNAMMEAGLEYPFVLDRETLEIVAHGQNPDLVGTDFEDKALGAFLPIAKIEKDLHDDGDTTFAYYSILDLATGSIPVKIALFQLHDGYIISAGQSFVIYTK